MMICRGLLVLAASLQFLQFYEARRSRPQNNGPCENHEYQCENGRCIEKNLFCDEFDDCEDNSDESYCSAVSCPEHYPFLRCNPDSYYSQCIPNVWYCDGVSDCLNGRDESYCLDAVEKIDGVYNVRNRAETWLIGLRNKDKGNSKWGSFVTRIAVMLHLSNPQYFSGNNNNGSEIAYEVDNQVLSSILQNQTQVILLNELALHIQALLAACLDPRDFNGIDLVAKLRYQVDIESTYINPSVLLALCNARAQMNNEDVDKLVYAFKLEERRFWYDIQALSLIALSCVAELPNGPFINRSLITNMSLILKQCQHDDGSFGNIQTTALVMQAIFAAGEEDGDWDMDEAVRFLVKNQNADGSYGSLLDTYFVLPVLHYKSLVNISSTHCKKKSAVNDTEYILNNYNKDIEEKIKVKYSLWHRNEVYLIRSLEIYIHKNSTFFDVMNIAKSLDDQYRFSYNLVDSKPYVRLINGYQDDPENEKFWFFYKRNTESLNNKPTFELINLSPIEVIPKNNEEYIMWYRTGYWVPNHQQLSFDKVAKIA